MKKIEAIVRLSKFDDIKKALADIGVLFFTLSEVKGFGLQKEKRMYRGSSYDPDYIARLQIDIITTNEKAEDIIATIKESGSTGEVGDGKIVVFDIDNVYRIRNDDKGINAV